MLHKVYALLVVSFISIFFCFSQTTVVDPVFEQELIALNIDTNGATGDILNTDAEAVTSLSLTGTTTITDITGIEAFVNLTDLNLGNNMIADIDLFALGLLVSFRINNNQALNCINLTQNILLENVFIRGGISFGIPPPITEIDLSQNVNLVSFDADILNNVTDIIFPASSSLTNIKIKDLADPTLDLSLVSGLQDLEVLGFAG